MKSTQTSATHEIIAVKVHQWLKQWDKVSFDTDAHRSRPRSHFFLFTLPAAELKALSGIYRRTTEAGLPRALDLGIQRRHDRERSEEIREFVRYGYPWSDLSKTKRESGRFDDLLNPGWLPSAVVLNILRPEDRRLGKKVVQKDLVTVVNSDELTATIRLPKGFAGASWRPSQLHPFEIIDGQHRLWAFEDSIESSDFQLPVVAFHGLDISWQAYLFWSINIKPKRINTSLAFDLYPLLRTEDWLQRFDDRIYRETRAQELTEALWIHPTSPWCQRINMLGEPGLRKKMVSQAAWLRALTVTYVKAWEGPGVKIGGLFGAPVGKDEEVLPWSRAQQAAFLIFVWQKLRDAVKECEDEWAERLRGKSQSRKSRDLAFSGPHTLLNTDQGVRGMLHVTNDLCYLQADSLKLASWELEQSVAGPGQKEITEALKSLRKQKKLTSFLIALAKRFTGFDWRTSTAPGLSEEQRTRALVFRGSGGYKELRRQLLRMLATERGIGTTPAKKALMILGY